MSLFDDNDDSLLEKPLFLRINAEKNVLRDGRAFVNNNETVTIVDDSDDSECNVETIVKHNHKDFNMADNDNQWRDCDTSSSNTSPVKPKFINNGSVKKRGINSSKSRSKREERETTRKANKAAKQLEKIRHNANKEVLKTKSVTQSLKHCYAIIDTKLFDMCSQSIQQIFEEKEAKYELSDRLLVPLSVMWNRKEFSCGDNISQISEKVDIVEQIVEQNHILTVIEAKQFVEYVYGFIHKTGKTLLDYVLEIRNLIGNKNLSLIVYKLDHYFKKEKLKSNNQFRQRFNQLSNDSRSTKCSQNSHLPSITKDDVDLSIIDLNVKLLEIDSNFKVCLTKVNDITGLATQIFRFTRSIAESHARQHKNMQQNFEWCAEADNRNTVDPIDEKSFLSLWKKQLMEFPKISYEIANAIASKYQSPMCLLNAYMSVDKPDMLLSDIKVLRRQPNGGYSERKVGNEISYRIHFFMTSKNGNELLNRV